MCSQGALSVLQQWTGPFTARDARDCSGSDVGTWRRGYYGYFRWTGLILLKSKATVTERRKTGGGGRPRAEERTNMYRVLRTRLVVQRNKWIVLATKAGREETHRKRE